MEYIEPTEQSDIRLKDLVAAVWRSKWTVGTIMLLCLGTAVLLSFLLPAKYRAEGQLLLVQHQPSIAQTPEAAAMSPMVETPDTQAAMLISDGMAERTLAYLKNDALTKGQTLASLGISDEEAFRDSFDRHVHVDSPKDTSIITVDADGDTPQHATLLANAVCQAFVAWKNEIARRGVSDVADSLAKRARYAKDDMLKAEHRLGSFRSGHQVINLTAQQQEMVHEASMQDEAVAAAREDVDQEQAHADGLARRLKLANAAIKGSPVIRDDLNASQIQQQLTQAEEDVAQAEQKYTRNYPGIFEPLDARVINLKKQLGDAVKASLATVPTLATQGQLADDYRTAQIAVRIKSAGLAAAQVALKRTRLAMASLPSTEMTDTALVRDADLARQLYVNLESSLDNARYNEALVTGNIQVAQPATPPLMPYSPNLLLNLAIGLVLGILLSTCTVVIAEQNDRRPRDMEAVRRLVSGPIIGALPKFSRAQMKRVMRGEPHPQMVEAFNMARASLALAGSSGADTIAAGSRVLLVTSAMPREGKSLAAAELARSHARAGRTTVLIDADMRRPTQPRWFKNGHARGLAEVLTGRATLDEALSPTQTPNLTVLHTGSPDRNPTDLLCSPELPGLLSELRTKAEVIIIDAPACALLADALFLAPHADSIFHVVSIGEADGDLVREATRALRYAAPNSMVFFVNRAQRERLRGYDHYYRAVAGYVGPGSNGNGNGHSNGNGHGGERAVMAALPKAAPVGGDDEGRTAV